MGEHENYIKLTNLSFTDLVSLKQELMSRANIAEIRGEKEKALQYVNQATVAEAELKQRIDKLFE